MNGPEMLRILDNIARERHIDRDQLIENLEAAMVSAARKYFDAPDTSEFTCTMDRFSGEMVIHLDGEKVEIEPEALGRIAAQTAKQVMIQKFREGERASLLEEFSKRIGEIETGISQRYEGGAMIVQIGRAEGFMPRSEQIPGEQFLPGDRVRCLILDVREQSNHVKIVLSRSHPDFIRRLFEVEVPEVAERVIEIKAMAREAGYRTKLAVSSIDSKVDAVGACVGMRGSRIRNIVDELGGEKIDIVRWNESSQILIQNSLKPAEVSEVNLCFELGRATVVVHEDQLSLAIGKRGQNVRLAARLTGWDVDILTPAEFAKGLEVLEETMLPIEGVAEEMLDRLAALGMVSVFDIEEVGANVLVDELEIDEAVAQEMVERATEKGRLVAEQMQIEKEEADQQRLAEEESASRVLDVGADAAGDAQAAAILGGLPLEAPAGDQHESATEHSDDARAAAILGEAPPEKPAGESDESPAEQTEADDADDEKTTAVMGESASSGDGADDDA
ncbi:MAG: transcription termination factor NusA [Phycisphaerales bacterium]|nr:transcription termination factor NusA [Phycisphaerales bacterium]